MKKSYLVQFILNVFFGPLGLFYSSVAAAIAFTIAAVMVAFVTFFVGAFFVWPITILVGFYTVSRYNKKVDLDEQRHQELMNAKSAE